MRASFPQRALHWLGVADAHLKERSISGWPFGLGWPQERHLQEQIEKDSQTTKDSNAILADATQTQAEDLDYCTIWLGNDSRQRSPSSSRDSGPPTRVAKSDDWNALMSHNTGIAVIYFPLLPNPRVPGVHPDESKFMSTWNFAYTAEEFDKVATLAKSNFEEGEEQVKDCVRAIYERKKRIRLKREDAEKSDTWTRRLKSETDLFA